MLNSGKLRKYCLISAFALALIPLSVQAQRGGRVGTRGPRGGNVDAVRGPFGAGAIDAEGPRGGEINGVRGPFGAGTVEVEGPRGGEAEAVVGPRGRGSATVEGFRGNEATVYGRVRYNDINVVRRPYVGYPGYRTYGVYYGLYPPLTAYPGLAFLTAGLLVASFNDNSGTTVYVYHIEKDCQVIEYQVDENGNVISEKSVGTADDC